MTAKPATERMAALRQRRTEAGLKRLELWARPELHQSIKAAAANIVATAERKMRGRK